MQKNADALCPNLPEDPATDELIHRRKRHCLWKICARKLLKTLFCKTYCHSWKKVEIRANKNGKVWAEIKNSYINLFKTLREEDSIFYMHPPVVNGEKKPRRLCVPEKFARCGFVDKCVFSARENTYRSRSLFHSSSLPRSNDTFKK